MKKIAILLVLVSAACGLVAFFLLKIAGDPVQVLKFEPGKEEPETKPLENADSPQ